MTHVYLLPSLFWSISTKDTGHTLLSWILMWQFASCLVSWENWYWAPCFVSTLRTFLPGACLVLWLSWCWALSFSTLSLSLSACSSFTTACLLSMSWCAFVTSSTRPLTFPTKNMTHQVCITTELWHAIQLFLSHVALPNHGNRCLCYILNPATIFKVVFFLFSSSLYSPIANG